MEDTMSEQTELTRNTARDEMERFQAGRRVRPAVDIYDHADEILLLADLPGVAGGDLSVSFEQGELTIEGSRKLPAGRNEEPATVIYTRTFRLPQGIDTDKIAADLKHGVLSVHLPRSEELKPRQISVVAG
jgi:HSP20 family protein